MNAGPHAVSVAASLEEMRRRYAEMPDPALTADRHSRQITLALHEAVMPMLAADRDAGGGAVGDEHFAQGCTHAIGNLLASLASCFVQGPEDLPRQTLMLGKASVHRAMLRAMAPNRGVVVWHGEPAAPEDASPLSGGRP